ncbi:penicillin acylase II precursor [Aeropyrum pernix K1]|uniref:Penicillin acylase II n=1 Tax=Aeropyrum pernix (strain ATCC 700893 / DSM 11879 / JCM 9820 / NBRC 100138 / K1) TaxID=272557 RepID=Q9YFA5_AERPE|nr:penicillin acylase family protein [Aeropyrum pernix]BAA79291.2 penicillin acylase II precursor [Aeropyrum pernix K1]
MTQWARSGATVVSALLTIILLSVPLVNPLAASLLDPKNGIIGGLGLDPPSGELSLPEDIPGEAKVYFDDEGVPYIHASSDEAAFYAAGWVHASLRLFQMDVFRRVGLGELSGLVGEAGLEADRRAAILGLRSVVDAEWRHIQNNPEFGEIVRIVEAYTAGVNGYISYALKTGRLPVEYRVLGVKPSPWLPQDTLAMAKVLALMLSYSEDDLILDRLVRKWGPEVIADFDIVGRSLNMPHASCDMAVDWGDVTGLEGPYNPLLSVEERREPLHESEPLDLGYNPDPEIIAAVVDRVLYMLSWNAASNNWVVSGSLTVSGNPLLANDPHLSLTAPGIWLPIVISSPSYSLAGVTIPGVPLVVIGRNSHVAWGFTNVGSDFTDFYRYQWVDENRYFYKGRIFGVEKSSIEAYVWDPLARSYRVQEISVARTIHGPVIEWQGEKFAVSYTSARPTFEMIFLWLLNKASSVRDALSAQRYFYGPPQNMVVADSAGNIAYSPVGAYPERATLPTIETGYGPIVNTGFLPFDGSAGEGEWRGFKPYSSLPVLFNPPQGFVATANSKPFEDGCWDGLGWDYADRFRTERIYTLLQERSAEEPLDAGDMRDIQLDVEDLGLKTLVSLMVRVASGDGGHVLERYMDMLAEWAENPQMNVDDYKPTLALLASWYFARDFWESLYGSEEHWRFIKLEYAEKALKAYLRGEDWVFNYFPEGTLEGMVNRSVERAVKTSETFFASPNPEAWVYGEMHYYNPEHLLSEALGFGECPAPGGPFTVNVAPPSSVSETRGAPVEAGPSVRLIADLSTTMLYMSLPGGSSGVPLSSFYDNLYWGYCRGEYHILTVGGEPPGGAKIVFRGG